MKSEKFWNKRAQKFDQEDKPDSPVRKERYARIRSYLNKNKTLLDYGCATGSLSLEFGNDVKEILGIDISAKMIELARIKAKDNNYQNLKFVQGEIHDDQFKSTRFDVIIAFYVIHLVQNPQKTLNHLAELINPEGFLIMEVPCLKQTNFIKRFFLKGFTKMAGLPYMHTFKSIDIDKMIKGTGLKVVENHFDDQKFPRYFIVAKKEN